MNVLGRVREEQKLSMRSMSQQSRLGWTVSKIANIEKMPDGEIPLKYLQEYSCILKLPLAAFLEDEVMEHTHPIRRGQLLQAYRHCLTIIQTEQNRAIINRILQIMGCIERALPDIFTKERLEVVKKQLGAYPVGCRSRSPDEISPIEEKMIHHKWYDNILQPPSFVA